MIKVYLNIHTTNILKNFISDDSYFITSNTFFLNFIKIGPFSSEKTLDIKINDFINTKFKYDLVERNCVLEDNQYYYIEVINFIDSQKFNSNIPIKSDLKMDITGSGVDFYYWVNPWNLFTSQIKVQVFNQEHKVSFRGM